MKQAELIALARRHGTPLVVVDHDILRRNYATFKRHLPRVQAYYAVKANSDPAIVRTFYKAGASFDVASWPEFQIVNQFIKRLPARERQDWIWDKIIYANPIKATETLELLDPYKPLVTFDNAEEIRKIRRYAPHAGLALRVRVPNTGSMVELSAKFGASPGESVDLILAAQKAGLSVEGLSFHVGSQCTNFENFVQAINMSAAIFQEARERGYGKMNLLDIGGGFPAPYDASVKPFRDLARKINAEIDRLFPRDIEILAEPGRFMVATAATSVAKVIGKAVRDGKLCYYIDDGVYSTYSGIVFDHGQYPVKAFRKGPRQICSVFGPTCDSFDTISLSESLPANLELDDLVYSENIGAYSVASATRFNGFPPAKVIHINQ
jgi:ornithine decarboxylase